MKKYKRGYCPDCGRFACLRKDGTTFAHGSWGRSMKCIAGGQVPDILEVSIGKWAVKRG